MSYDMYFSSFSHAWTVSLSSALTFKFEFPSSSEWPLIARPYLKRKRNEVICFKRPARRLACRFASGDEIMTSTPWAVFLKDNFITAALWVSDASCFLNFSNDFFQLLKPHVVKASSPNLLKFRRHLNWLPCKRDKRLYYVLNTLLSMGSRCTTFPQMCGPCFLLWSPFPQMVSLGVKHNRHHCTSIAEYVVIEKQMLRGHCWQFWL